MEMASQSSILRLALRNHMVLDQTHNTPRQCVQKSLLNSCDITEEY